MPKKSTKKLEIEKSVSNSKAVGQVLNNALLDQIAMAIKASKVPGVAALEGSRLTQHWIEELAKFDSQYPTVAVELPFFIILEKYTVIVGMQDRIALDGAGLFGCEWKTTKGTTRYWNEGKWLEQIKTGPQISVYGLGQHEGYFVLPKGTPWQATRNSELVQGELGGPVLWRPEVKTPRILVRAITKEDPPNFWGVDPPAFFEINKNRLDTVREALLIKGEQIRAARNRGTTPWQLTGTQCMDRFKFGEFCRFHEECLRSSLVQIDKVRVDGEGQVDKVLFNDDDPGSAALKAVQSMMRVPLNDPRVVVLSASAYGDVTDCMELYRRTAIQGSKKNPELDKGTALHAGVAEFYRRGMSE